MAVNIMSICNSVSNLIESVRPPATPIPPSILAIGAIYRPGVSPMLVASNIIARQSEAGAPYGPMADGSKNISEAMERIRIEEIMKSLKFDSQVEIAIPPGGITIMATGANSGGPVTVTGVNTNFVQGFGIIQ